MRLTLSAAGTPEQVVNRLRHQAEISLAPRCTPFQVAVIDALMDHVRAELQDDVDTAAASIQLNVGITKGRRVKRRRGPALERVAASA